MSNRVMVVDAHRQYVGHIRWAVARKALRERRATVFKREPFTIQLPFGETRLPSFKVATTKKEQDMNYAQPQVPGVQNWMRFFAEERDIWVQNLSPNILSLQFDLGHGEIRGTPIPVSPDPYPLTQEVPFEAIKRSMDFRKFLNAQPPVCQLMTEQEAMAYFADKAAAMNAWTTGPDGQRIPNTAAAIAEAERERKALRQRALGEPTVVKDQHGNVHFTPPRSAQELQALQTGVAPGFANAASAGQPGAAALQGFVNAPQFQQQAAAGGEHLEPVMVDQVIKPRVLYVCQQVAPQLAPAARWTADQVLRELRPLEATLTIDDLAYIESHGGYPTVKNWVRGIMERREPMQDTQSAEGMI